MDYKKHLTPEDLANQKIVTNFKVLSMAILLVGYFSFHKLSLFLLLGEKCRINLFSKADLHFDPIIEIHLSNLPMLKMSLGQPLIKNLDLDKVTIFIADSSYFTARKGPSVSFSEVETFVYGIKCPFTYVGTKVLYRAKFEITFLIRLESESDVEKGFNRSLHFFDFVRFDLLQHDIIQVAFSEALLK